MVFSNKRVNKESLQLLILARTNKWGKATGILDFGNDPLWRVNPYGAIALHNHRVSSNFWKYKHELFDIVCVVDGAWGVNLNKTKTSGGIGGTIKNKNGLLIHVFTGPVAVGSSEEAEMEAIIYVLRLVGEGKLGNTKIVVCSDSITTP